MSSLPDLEYERGHVFRVPYPQGELWRGWLVHVDLLRAIGSRTWLLGGICGAAEKLVANGFRNLFLINYVDEN